MILGNSIKLCRVDRDASKGLYLHLFYDIVDNEGKKIIKIVKLNGEEIKRDKEFISTPFNDCDFIYLNTNSLYNTISNVSVEILNEDGSSLTENVDVKNFNCTFDKRENINNFFWNVENFSDIDIYSYIKIIKKSNNKEVIRTKEFLIKGRYNENLQVTTDITPLINDQEYIFQIIIKAEKKEYVMEQRSFIYKANNRKPSVMLHSAKIIRNLNNFTLNLKALFRDADLDNIMYEVYDSDSNIIFQRDSYKHSPSLENIIYNYDKSSFSRLAMSYIAEVKDINTMYDKSQIEIDLFSIKNLRRERKRLTWEYQNFSNVRLNMQVEVIDFDDNIIYKSEIISKTESKDKITIIDSGIIDYFKNDLDFDYYRFRLRVWSNSEIFERYYQFEKGTTFVPIENYPPELKIISGSLSRNELGEKIIKLKVFIDDKNKDRLSYSIFCEENLINKSNIDIIVPYSKELVIPYDFYNKLKVNINFTVYDEFNLSTSQTKELKAYQIYNATVKDGYLFTLEADNLSNKPLFYKLEVNDSKENIFTSDEFKIDETLTKTKFNVRWLPKREGTFKYRFIVYEKDESGNVLWEEFYPNKEFTEFRGSKNLPPTIFVTKCEYSESENKKNILLNAELNDPNLDRITYLVKFKINNSEEILFVNQKELVETPLMLNSKRSFNYDDVTRNRVPYVIEVCDEEGLKTIYNGNLDLFNIGDIFRSNNKFHFSYRIYGSKSLKGRIEILNNDGSFAAIGEEKILAGGNKDYLHHISEFQFNGFDDGLYYFRLKIWSEDEGWNQYYPNYEGISFGIATEVPNLLSGSGNFKDSLKKWVSHNEISTIIDTNRKYNGFNTIRTSGNGILYKDYILLEPDTEYTYSTMIKADKTIPIPITGSTPIHLWLYLNEEDNVHLEKIIDHSSEIKTNWSRCWITFKTPKGNDFYKMKPFIFLIPEGNFVNVANMKVEKGKISTEWKPSYEEIGIDKDNTLIIKKPSINKFEVKNELTDSNYDLKISLKVDNNGKIIYVIEDDNEN